MKLFSNINFYSVLLLALQNLGPGASGELVLRVLLVLGLVGGLETFHVELAYFRKQTVPAFLQILGQDRKLVYLTFYFLPLVPVLLVNNVVDERNDDLVYLFVGGVKFLL